MNKYIIQSFFKRIPLHELTIGIAILVLLCTYSAFDTSLDLGIIWIVGGAFVCYLIEMCCRYSDDIIHFLGATLEFIWLIVKWILMLAIGFGVVAAIILTIQGMPAMTIVIILLLLILFK